MPEIAHAYKSVVRAAQGPFSASALVGANTAVIGWDVDPAYDRSQLLGFAIRQTEFDPENGEIEGLFWLEGQKRFKIAEDDLGVNVNSNKAPFQRFRWSDYTLNPGTPYQFDIFPITGTPQNLMREKPLQLSMHAASYFQNGLGVYVNRGVTAARAYLNRFRGSEPDWVPGGAAYTWLSRGLKESLIDFIQTAQGGEELHVAIYELHDAEVAAALKNALDRDVDVKIVYHAVSETQRTVMKTL